MRTKQQLEWKSLRRGGGTLGLNERIILKFKLKFSGVLQTSAESRTLLKTNEKMTIID
jgi:hypothetical protein